MIIILQKETLQVCVNNTGLVIKKKQCPIRKLSNEVGMG